VKWLPVSLAWRTFAVLLAALVLSQAFALWLVHEYVTQPRVERTIRVFVSHLKTLTATLDTIAPAERAAFVARIAEQDGILVAPPGTTQRMIPARDRPNLELFRERLHEAFGSDAEVYVRASETEEASGPARMLWVRLPSGGTQHWIGFPRGRAERDPLTAYVLWGAVGLAIAVLATFSIAWRLNRPLEALTRAAARIGRGGTPEPVPEIGPREIRAVASAFNEMSERLQANERDRATFLAGISHDLRTPLARLRLEVEMLEGKVDPESQRGMERDLADMNVIIDQFIDFTRSEAAEPLSRVDLAELAHDCAQRAARGGAQVVERIEDVPPLFLRPLAMRRLIDNLLVNAQRHAGGEIELRTASHPDGAVLAVLDRGPGIPPSLVDHLKQPFTRRDDARSGKSGAGLGLAIANRVAALHGGRLDLLPRPGGGLEARLVLPLEAAA
jgi:two-component system, OmpR family, osmolarity sensor histidine kinase EnvZ